MASDTSNLESVVSGSSVVASVKPISWEVSEHLPLPPELRPNIDHIVTEDGAPLDNWFSERQQRLLTESLYCSWLSDRPFVAVSNVGLFYQIKQPPLVPDMMLSMDVRIPENPQFKENRSYLIWEYGKPPDLVIEIVSNKDGGEDTLKLKEYARLGISHYVIYDPFEELGKQRLRVYERIKSRYEKSKSKKCWFPDLGIGLDIWQGTYEDFRGAFLRWTDSSGEFLLSGEQQSQRADLESQRAERESRRAEQESQRAEQASRRAERLAEQLRKLGVNPEALDD